MKEQKPSMDLLVPHWWAGVGNGQDQLPTESVFLEKLKAWGRKKQPRGLKHITANSFPHICMLPEYYMCLLAPHEYTMHPTWLLILKIGTSA